MSSMMPDVMAAAKPTLASGLTQSAWTYYESTLRRVFLATLASPPSFVFLIWPTISVAQIATLLYSALLSAHKEATTLVAR
jgi:hypothetical protein